MRAMGLGCTGRGSFCVTIFMVAVNVVDILRRRMLYGFEGLHDPASRMCQHETSPGSGAA